MPKSRVRKKKTGPAYVPPTAAAVTRKKKRSRRWVGPTVLSLLGFGVVWLVFAYLTQASVWPQTKFGDWNVVIGFGFIASGFALATQWH